MTMTTASTASADEEYHGFDPRFNEGDITLIATKCYLVDYWAFKVPSSVLSEKSEVFRVMFETVNGNNQEVHIPGVQVSVLEIFVSAIMGLPVAYYAFGWQSMENALELCKLYDCSISVARSILASGAPRINAWELDFALAVAIELGDAQCAYPLFLEGHRDYDNDMGGYEDPLDARRLAAVAAPPDWTRADMEKLPKEWIWALAFSAGEAHSNYEKDAAVQSAEYWRKVADGFRKYMEQIGEWD